MQTGMSVGKIVKPSFLTSAFFPPLALATLALDGYMLFQLYYAEFLRNQLICVEHLILQACAQTWGRS